eukprot:64596-Pleurochrysis_carterae.AAC.1
MATVNRPDIAQLSLRMESVDARTDCLRIALRNGGGRILHDISAKRGLKTVFENGGVVWKVSIAVGDVNVPDEHERREGGVSNMRWCLPTTGS